MSRLKGRIEAAEFKAGIGREDHRINLFFVEGWPSDGAAEFLKSKGHDLSKPNRIVCFVPAKDGKAMHAPLKSRQGTGALNGAGDRQHMPQNLFRASLVSPNFLARLHSL